MTNLLLISFFVAVSASACLHEFKYLHPSLMLSCFSAFFLLTLAIFHHLKRQTSKVYLVDFACYKPSDSCAITNDMFVETLKRIGAISEENLKRIKKIVDKSGLGPKTYLPQAIMQNNPPKVCLDEARKETETVLFGAIDELLEKTWVQPKDIGILVVTCSTFSPTPSLCDMIVNRYKLRHNILCYNLSGMGCSAGVLALDFAKRLLQSHPNSYAMVLSTENANTGIYLGNNLSMLLVNCLCRMGGSASLLSSHPSDRHRSKYQIIHTLRTHMASDDKSYKCVFQQDDDQHEIGISISEDLTNVVGQVVKRHITSLAPLVLPVSEKLKFLVTFVGRKVLRLKIEAYALNLKLVFDHFCIHSGGRAVVDTMQKSLDLQDWDVEPSRMTLYRFGNTSSSSVWYELAYCEAKGRIKRGDKIWQMAFGAGFMCNSVVWVVLDDVEAGSTKNPWRDDIHEFPANEAPVGIFPTRQETSLF
ncbi:3-ketoacyl-CoA synthase 2-like [Prosopis cineraria]|uniref:3-ketoacyl-CoA synthase 2-like n=1 Tax=Prosopis cineraria TaxID=364024 RepID=UPI00240F9F42|nr:3-ketoacyl-CoA synthase 2-like [Prosopis cineraria]